eukprot:8549436-Pyramimonas_sp.AAC.1
MPVGQAANASHSITTNPKNDNPPLGTFSCRTNQTQEARVYSHGGPIRLNSIRGWSAELRHVRERRDGRAAAVEDSGDRWSRTRRQVRCG